MTIRVYFGPYKHSPAQPPTGGEATLWCSEFHLLRGYDRDFWSNNPFILDCFEPNQIMLWRGEQWLTMPEAIRRVIPAENQAAIGKISPGRAAIIIEVISLIEKRAAEQGDDDIDAEKIRAELRAAIGV